MGNILYTIGHSNHKAVEFLQLLKTYSITAVVDVRSSPFSRMNPQYNENALRVHAKITSGFCESTKLISCSFVL